MSTKRKVNRRQISDAHTAESWNTKHKVGTPVRYWPIWPPRESAPPIDTATRSEAWELHDGTAVVMIDGRSGCVALSHIELRLDGSAVRP